MLEYKLLVCLHRVFEYVVLLFMSRVAGYMWLTGIRVMDIYISRICIRVVGWYMGCEYLCIVR